MSSRSITRFIPTTIITIITITTTIIIISRCLVQSRTRAPYFRTTSTDARRILANARASRECTRRGFPGDFGKFDRRRIFMRACCVKRTLISPSVFAAICKERSVNNEFSAVPPPPLSLSLSFSLGWTISFRRVPRARPRGRSHEKTNSSFLSPFDEQLAIVHRGMRRS